MKIIALLFALASSRPQDAVVILGDSVAHGAGDETRRGIAGNLAGSAVNLGIDGARTATVLHLLESAGARSAIARAKSVIVSIGGNDLYGSKAAQLVTTAWPSCSMRFVLPQVRKVVERLHRINPGARVILLGLYNPYRGRSFVDTQVNVWDSQLIALFAHDRLVDVVRIADVLRSPGSISPLDHFHPSAAGYAMIAARIGPAIGAFAYH